MEIKKIALYEVQSNRFHIYKSKYSFVPRLGLCVIANKLKHRFPDVDTEIFLGELAVGWTLGGFFRKLLRMMA